MFYLKLFSLALPLFFCIDLIWLGLLAKNLYRMQIGFLLSDRIRWGAALLFYFIYVGGLILFVIAPSIKQESVKMALIYGAFFGLVCYATYDLTNLATLKGWPVKLVIYDLVWGSIISATTSSIVHLVGVRWR